MTYTGPPEGLQPGRYRLLIQEHEILRADGVPTSTLRQRLVYAETLPLDGPLLTARPRAAASTAPRTDRSPGRPDPPLRGVTVR